MHISYMYSIPAVLVSFHVLLARSTTTFPAFAGFVIIDSAHFVVDFVFYTSAYLETKRLVTTLENGKNAFPSKPYKFGRDRSQSK